MPEVVDFVLCEMTLGHLEEHLVVPENLEHPDKNVA